MGVFKRNALILTLTSAAFLGLRAEQQFTSGPTQVALIELYTSEGCSSCPPAERWLSELTRHEGLWRDFVPVAFHVDYWDRLGWKDNFASRSATQRQYDYAKTWQSGSVYTPCFVRNGQEWRRRAKDLQTTGSATVGQLTLMIDNLRDVKIDFSPAVNSKGDFDVLVALLGSDMVSSVRAGENAGSDLHHDFTVLELKQVALGQGDDGHHRASITFEREAGAKSKRLAVAAWSVRRGSMIPVQATGGWLDAAAVN